MTNKEILIQSINEDAGYKYVSDDDHSARDDIVTTRDTVEGFKECQKHVRTTETTHGTLEVFVVHNFELYVMDFGEHRLALKDS